MWKVLVAVVCLSTFVAIAAQAQDLGNPDTLTLVSNGLAVGESRPIEVWVANDEELLGMQLTFQMSRIDLGFARFDSIVGIGRLLDPSVLNQRSANKMAIDGLSPDTLSVVFVRTLGNALPIGSGPIATLYFTGLSVGQMRIDTARNRIGNGTVMVGPDLGKVYPLFSSIVVNVVTDSTPPIIHLTSSVSRVVAGLRVSFGVSANMRDGGLATLSLGSVRDYDDSTRTPANSPQYDGLNPGTFSWTPGPSDLGIWSVTFRAEDVYGKTSELSARVEVVSNSVFDLALSSHVTDSSLLATGVAHGDFNGDNFPEIVLAGWPRPWADFPMASYKYDGYGHFTLDWNASDHFARKSVLAGYFGTDDAMDLAAGNPLPSGLWLYCGNGDNTFARCGNNPPPGGFRSAVSCDFNHDDAVDIASVENTHIYIFAGHPDSDFVQIVDSETTDPGLNVNSADFNNDGWDDLAVGTMAGLDIYLNDRHGGLIKAHHYDQTYAVADIDVTNQGSDFNGDNQYDLCLATPSIGGLNSNLIVYLGNPDGSFSQQFVKTVQGQIFANCTGDFNGDTFLDIAYINGAKRYLAILFGDGTGHFFNEARYNVPSYDPYRIDCMDIDLDGDLDIVVNTYVFDVGSQLVLFENPLNPPGYSAVPFQTFASGNVDVEISTPSGGVINNVRNSVASGSFYRKALDGDSRLDAIATAAATEPGEYRISVSPKKDRTGDEPFSLRYRIGKTEYRIASNVTMPPEGYSFPVYPNGDSPVRPALGEYIDSPQPTFSWQGTGQFEFELALDASFTTIVDRATVSGASYTPDVLLQKSETSPYYWRVRPAGADSWGTFSSFNVAASPTDVDGGPTDDVPASFWLSQNYPNPFNPSTVIEFNLPKAAQVKVEIFNVVGQKIATVIDRKVGAGKQSIEWNGHDALGKPVASGVYFYRISSEEFTATRKMVLLR